MEYIYNVKIVTCISRSSKKGFYFSRLNTKIKILGSENNKMCVYKPKGGQFFKSLLGWGIHPVQYILQAAVKEFPD